VAIQVFLNFEFWIRVSDQTVIVLIHIDTDIEIEIDLCCRSYNNCRLICPRQIRGFGDASGMLRAMPEPSYLAMRYLLFLRFGKSAIYFSHHHIFLLLVDRGGYSTKEI
jgi:hypothetical protein